MNILDQLAAHARQRVETVKQQLPPAEVKRQALTLPMGGFRFEKALAKPGLAFICECKKASPSKGLIAPDFPYLQIALCFQRPFTYKKREEEEVRKGESEGTRI